MDKITQAANSTPIVPLLWKSTSRWLWLWAGLFLVLWLDLIRVLSQTWETREQYSYGWFVPFLAIYLLWLRWATRPAPGNGPLHWQTVIVLVGSLSLLPLRVVLEINSDWPLVSWIYALVTVGLTLHGVRLLGGLRWVRHFAFPVAFILVGVAWPNRIEKGLTQELMQVVAAITVEMLGWLDIPAMQRGNLIEVAAGVVGVDEACSGIRSFQSTWMAALFLGELYRLRWIFRGFLVLAGLATAFGFNVVRTLFLSWQASVNGLSAIDKWHDGAGLTILLVSFACLWLVCVWMQRAKLIEQQPTSGDQVNVDSAHWTSTMKFMGWVGVICLLSLFATEVWYRMGDANNQGGFGWEMAFPTNKSNFKPAELTPRVVGLLRHDSGGGASWNEDDGTDWSVFFFRWEPRSVQSVIYARAHRPDVCLPGAGLKQVGDSTETILQAGEQQIPFRRYTYELNGRMLHVFFCQWENGNKHQGVMKKSKQLDRLQTVFTGRRRVGQQTLEFILGGHASLEEAESALKMALPGLIRLDTGY